MKLQNTKRYWDMRAHNLINKYLGDNATIIDIGANIGSHSIYWALTRSAKKVYAFEPLNETYEILKTNIDRLRFAVILLSPSISP